MGKAQVLADVNQERVRQDILWGVQDHDIDHWVVILGEEFGEVCRAAFEKLPSARLREEIIQVAAVAVAMVESLDREN